MTVMRKDVCVMKHCKDDAIFNHKQQEVNGVIEDCEGTGGRLTE